MSLLSTFNEEMSPLIGIFVYLCMVDMKARKFFGKFVSGYLIGNLLAMLLVVVALCVGVKYGLDKYTRHGEQIAVPTLVGTNYASAMNLLAQDGLCIEVSDSGYSKVLPANTILAQTPAAGSNVKQGHTIYVTINSPSSPTFAIPDIVDNSSVREATAKLTAMGFRLMEPRQVEGERDWVYGVECRGRRLSAGDRVSIEETLTLVIGNGRFGEENIDDFDEMGDVAGEDTLFGPTDGLIIGAGGDDDFQEVGPEG